MTTFYCLKFGTPPIWRVKSPHLYTPGTGWPCFTPRHWFNFSVPPTTRRAGETASTDISIKRRSPSFSYHYSWLLKRAHIRPVGYTESSHLIATSSTDTWLLVVHLSWVALTRLLRKEGTRTEFSRMTTNSLTRVQVSRVHGKHFENIGLLRILGLLTEIGMYLNISYDISLTN
jgi:hypothetical protein